ncbi:hypothetical protein H7169_02505 [Candidatus Gracilibacteria bacterium]|nr:hypothetical protein [Candidatus Gracilibacteria bacterium]
MNSLSQISRTNYTDSPNTLLPVNNQVSYSQSDRVTDVRNDTQDRLQGVLRDTIGSIGIGDLTFPQIGAAENPVIFETGDHYTSVAPTATLPDGIDVYTMRYGITTISSAPPFTAISLLFRNPDGHISHQGVIGRDSRIEEYHAIAEEVATHLAGPDMTARSISLSEVLKEVREVGDDLGNIYHMGVNPRGESIYLTTLYEIGTDIVGLQFELRKFIDKDGQNSIYIGGMANSGSIKIATAMKYILTRGVKLGIDNDWRVYFFRDDAHTDTSAVRTVAEYYRIAGMHRS